MPAEFPWIFEYADDPVVGTESRWGRAVLRPLVEVRVLGPTDSARAFALVDSGTDYTLIAPWVAQDRGAHVHHGDPLRLGIGGETVTVRQATVGLKFGPTDVDEDEWVEWHADVGVVEHWRAQWPVVLGQRGFFDAFTVCMSRTAQLLVVSDRDDLDQRFG